MKRPANTIAARAAPYEALERGELSLGETVRRLRKIIGKTQAEYASLGVRPKTRLLFSMRQRSERLVMR